MHKVLKCCRTEGVVCAVLSAKIIWFYVFRFLMLIVFDIKSKEILSLRKLKQLCFAIAGVCYKKYIQFWWRLLHVAVCCDLPLTQMLFIRCFH